MPVEVISCTNAGGVSAIGTVDIQPLVSAVDGSGKLWEHGIIYGVPYLRIQGGANAVVLDPQAGDIGIASICDRDISAVKSTAGVSGPGSLRKHDMSDAVYLSTVISKSAPTQYVLFSASGITMLSPSTVTIQAPTIDLIGQVNQSGGTMNAATSVITPVVTASTSMSVSGKDVGTHYHSGVATGTGNTGAMVG